MRKYFILKYPYLKFNHNKFEDRNLTFSVEKNNNYKRLYWNCQLRVTEGNLLIELLFLLFIQLFIKYVMELLCHVRILLVLIYFRCTKKPKQIHLKIGRWLSILLQHQTPRANEKLHVSITLDQQLYHLVHSLIVGHSDLITQFREGPESVGGIHIRPVARTHAWRDRQKSRGRNAQASTQHDDLFCRANRVSEITKHR